MDPKPELRPTTESIRGLYGPNHDPIGECTIQIQVLELAVVVSYDAKVEAIDGHQVTFSKDGDSQTLQADLILMSVGRRPNVQGLEHLGPGPVLP